MRALGNEVAKNLVLAGIGTVTIMDPDVVLDEDLCAQFLVSTDDIGKSVRSHAFTCLAALAFR